MSCRVNSTVNLTSCFLVQPKHVIYWGSFWASWSFLKMNLIKKNYTEKFIRKCCVLLQVLCSGEMRTRSLHRSTHQMSLQPHRTKCVKEGTHSAAVGSFVRVWLPECVSLHWLSTASLSAAGETHPDTKSHVLLLPWLPAKEARIFSINLKKTVCVLHICVFVCLTEQSAVDRSSWARWETLSRWTEMTESLVWIERKKGESFIFYTSTSKIKCQKINMCWPVQVPRVGSYPSSPSSWKTRFKFILSSSSSSPFLPPPPPLALLPLSVPLSL